MRKRGYSNMLPSQRLRFHLTMAIWHMKKAAIFADASAVAGEMIRRSSKRAQDITKECLDVIGGPHFLRTDR